ncbi:hypothetical protein GCM10027018_00830 [Paenibacillus thermoaerophilus]
MRQRRWKKRKKPCHHRALPYFDMIFGRKMGCWTYQKAATPSNTRYSERLLPATMSECSQKTAEPSSNKDLGRISHIWKSGLSAANPARGLPANKHKA